MSQVDSLPNRSLFSLNSLTSCLPGREKLSNMPHITVLSLYLSLTSGKFFFTLGMRAKTRYDSGTLPNCFAKQLWDQREKHNLTDLEVSSLSGGLFGAGSDTSSATMTTFILAMTVFGENVIPKAQAELDRVVGRNRSPTWSDEENLPYIRAVVKEAFRWRPVAVLGGTPHANTEDDYYNGYFIPKGSTILGNLWAVRSRP